MKVNSISQKIYKSRILKNGFKFAADYSPLFIAGTSFLFSAAVRSVAIWATPKVDRENKILHYAKSLSSAFIGFLIALGLSVPLAKSIKKIDTRPLKYLESETVDALKENGKILRDSKPYQLATQMFQLGLGFVIAAPKEILTNKLIPPVLKSISGDSKSIEKSDDKDSVFLNFSGYRDFIPKSMAKVLNKEGVQKFVQKYQDSNLRMHLIALSDIFATLVFAGLVNKNQDIKANKRRVLINNALISTGLCVGIGYPLDRVLKKPAQNFIKKFCEANKNDKNLMKYVEGIKIVKPTLIFGIVYYGLVPIISAFMTDRIEEHKNHLNIS